MAEFLYLAIGLTLGGVIGWLIKGKSAAPVDPRLENELRQQLAAREQETQQLRAAQTEAASARARAEAEKQAMERLLAEQRQSHERLLQEAKLSQDQALANLRDAFKSLSTEALRETQPEFLRLANETFAKFSEAAKGDLGQRQAAIATLVKPLEEQLRTYQSRLAQSENQQSTTLGEVKKQIELLALQSQSLSSETLQLRRVLHSSQARGKWGEETLRRVVEAAGMSNHCDFTEQSQSGDAKPDLTVHLPGDRIIIVDAKVPELEFLSALDTEGAGRRAELLQAHATKLRATIKALADRDYPSQFPNSLDYVVLFVPAESLFSAALEADQDLIVWAASRRILLATPASLIALLRSVSVSWQQHAQTENARQIAEAAQELYRRVVKFLEHFEKVGVNLQRAASAYNDAVGSYERKLRPMGERLQQYGGKEDANQFPDLKAVTEPPRLPPQSSG